MSKLVSIITPCYNGEKYLTRFFESLLAQTYPAVELIFVNDGSTDGSERMALAYGDKLKEKGYGFLYFYQQNAGQSAAINQGLNVFSGDYLNWTDCDNYLPAHSIEKRVAFMDNHPEAGLVIGRSAVVDDIHYKPIGMIQETGMDRTQPRQLAEDFLKGQMSCTCCCSTMVRSTMFRDSMPDPPQIDEYDCKNRLDILQHHQRKEYLDEIVQKMKNNGCYDAQAQKMVLKIHYPVIKRISDRLWKLRNK